VPWTPSESDLAWKHWGRIVEPIDRITFDPNVMGGKPCLRGLRVTVGMIVGLIASGCTHEQILADYPYLEPDDITAALTYAAWRAQEIDVPMPRP